MCGIYVTALRATLKVAPTVIWVGHYFGWVIVGAGFTPPVHQMQITGIGVWNLCYCFAGDPKGRPYKNSWFCCNKASGFFYASLQRGVFYLYCSFVIAVEHLR